MNCRQIFGAVLFALTALGLGLVAQNPAPPNSSTVQVASPYYALTPLSATAAVNTATVLTIPAPTQSGYYNYVCYLAWQGNNDNTATAVSNAVTTSANFNSFAAKVSQAATASNDTGVMVLLNLPYPGCAKSISPTTATTFTGPSSQTHEAFTWYTTYFQAP